MIGFRFDRRPSTFPGARVRVSPSGWTRVGIVMKRSRNIIVISAWLVLIHIVISCAPFAPDPREPETRLAPPAFHHRTDRQAPVERWWESFDAPQLNALVQEALGNNFSLQESWARLRQARALVIRSRAERFPDLVFDGSASVGRQQIRGGQESDDTVESYALGLSSSYEIDLWGRVDSLQTADALAAVANREDLNAAAITLAANVTTRWIGIMSQRLQWSLVKQQLAANQTLLELLELRFRKSLASALDVFQQRQLVEQSRAQLPLIEQSEYQLLHELAVLLGRTPFSIPEIEDAPLEIPANVPSTGLPVQLLTSRPDIRAAMRRLEASDWLVAAAKADRLPGIRLGVAATFRSEELGRLFDNWLVNLIADLTAPLYDGRRREAEVLRLEAVVAEDLAFYRATVLNAIREVEDALVGEAKLREHLAGLAAQLEAARLALSEARSRYRNGLNDYLPVLTQLLSVQNLERTQIQRQADLLVARVDLYRALGGQWTDRLKQQDGHRSNE